MTRETIIQRYLDAIDNRSVFCDGIINSLMSVSRKRIAFRPNCGVREECPLFRGLPYGQPIRQFHPVGRGDEENGCEAFQMLRQWDRDHQWWIVELEGCEPIEVQGRDALSAACVAWWSIRTSGKEVDKMVLFDKRYTVRER